MSRVMFYLRFCAFGILTFVYKDTIFCEERQLNFTVRQSHSVFVFCRRSSDSESASTVMYRDLEILLNQTDGDLPKQRSDAREENR